MAQTLQKQLNAMSHASIPPRRGDASTPTSQRDRPGKVSESSSHDALQDPAVLAALSKEHLIFNEEHRVDFANDSPTHPRQWPLQRKLYDSAIVCLLEFATTIISNAGSSIATPVARHIDISIDLSLFSLVTTYMLGQAIGGLLFPPITEVIGSKAIYIWSIAIYGAFCFQIGFFPVLPSIIIARFLCGMLSAMPSCVAVGSLENMWDSRARIWAISAWVVSGVLAMSVGPLTSMSVRQTDLGWKRVFVWAGVVCMVMSMLCSTMRESRPSQVLRQKAKNIEKQTGHKLPVEAGPVPTLDDFRRNSLCLPFHLFTTEPIVATASTIGAIVISLIYLFAEAVPIVYTGDFGLSPRKSALVFLIMGAGALFFFLPRLWDIRISNQRKLRKQTPEPEDKLYGFLIAAPLLAVGLWWFGATIPPVTKTSPYISMAPISVIGFAAVEFDTVLSGYLTDVYGDHAASANAPMCFLRATVSGVYPIIGRRMFQKLGSSQASFLLASLATVFVVVAVVFFRFGQAIRERSHLAQKTLGREEEEK